MDDPFAGDDRQHKQLARPAADPTSRLAHHPIVRGRGGRRRCIPDPAAAAPRRPRRRLVIGTALLVAAVVLVGTGLLATGNPIGALLAATAGGPGGAGQGGRAAPAER